MRPASPPHPSAVATRRARRCAVALVGLLCLVPAQAQEDPGKLEPPDVERYRRWGPLWARPGIEVSNLGYDTNILVSPPGQEVPDYTATVSPRLEGLLLFGRSVFLTFRDQLDYTAYLENGSQNYLDNRFESRATLPTERAGLFVELGLDNVQERPADLQDIRTRRQEHKLEAGLILEPGWRTELELSAGANRLTYTDRDEVGSGSRTVGDVLDRTESTVRLDASWRAAGRTKLLLDAQLQKDDFEDPGLVNGVPIDRDGNAWRLLPGVRFGAGGPLEGEVRAGWGGYSPREADLPSFSDWLGDMNLAYLLGWRTRLIFTGERLLSFSVIEGSPYYLQATAGLRVIHYVTRVIGIEAGASGGTLTFPGSFNAQDRVDDLRNWDGGVRFRMFQGDTGGRLEYSLRVVHYDRQSNVPGVARAGTTLSMGVVAGF